MEDSYAVAVMNAALMVPEVGKMYQLIWPDEWLQLGRPLYISFNAEQQAAFSEHPQSGFTRHVITSIDVPILAPDEEPYLEVTVRAQTPPHLFDDHFGEIETVLSELVPSEVIQRALRNIASTYRVQDIGLTLARRASEANTFVTVARRLDLCRRLAGQGGADLIHTHQRNLVLYLLLTCFDRLGQPAPYLTFENWLDSKKSKHREKRDAALIGVADDPVAQARALNQAYVAEYGVRNSFFRFLDEILPRSQYERLMASLWGQHMSWGAREPESMPEAEKRKYLYQLRNAYTHQAEARPGLTIPLPEGIEETPVERTFYFYDQVSTRAGTDTMSFSDWPRVLEDCVLHGLAERVRRASDGLESIPTR